MFVSGRTGLSREPAAFIARAALCALATFAPAITAVAQPTFYKLVEVVPPDAVQSNAGEAASPDAMSTAIDIDPTGTYVTGYASPQQGQRRAFLWSGGASVWLGTGGPVGVGSEATAVNASGQVVGREGVVPYRWIAGNATALESTTGRAGALSINAAGHAVGFDGHALGSEMAVLWPAGTSSGAVLPGGLAARPHDINDAGDIVGTSWPTSGGTKAVRWTNGVVSTLAQPVGYEYAEATDINPAGQIIGVAWRFPTNPIIRGPAIITVGVLWSGGIPTLLAGTPAGINAAGQIVGNAGNAVLWDRGVRYDLTSLLDASGAGHEIRRANAISDDGKIAAIACSTSSGAPCRAVVLVPAPPPPPVRTYTRYLAEGATSTFFDTQIALLNPGSVSAAATLRFLPAGGAPIEQALIVPAGTRRTIHPKLVPGLANAEFSTIVQASQELVVDRTMTWDATGYGSHSETSVTSPASTWYLAEGATIGGFDLFYLLQNPAATSTTVSVRYLRSAGPPLTKVYVLPPLSRTNIWVNVEEFPGLGKALAASEVSAVITSEDATPIIVERAMYRSGHGRSFDAGHESTGVTAPTTEWFLAEGATGAFFDMFVLIANPTATDAQVTVTYLTIDGTTYSRTLVAPANARSGIWVDRETFPGVAGLPLADAALSTTVRSTNGVPLVVERAMWWPGDSSTWHEAHNSAGATATGTRWAVAEGEVGGTRGHETYLLIANTSASAGHARVTLLFEDGTSMENTYALAPSSRTNVAVASDFGAAVAGKRFGAVVESTGLAPVEIVVERAMYSSVGGVTFAAGTSALATKLQ